MSYFTRAEVNYRVGWVVPISSKPVNILVRGPGGVGSADIVIRREGLRFEWIFQFPFQWFIFFGYHMFHVFSDVSGTLEQVFKL